LHRLRRRAGADAGPARGRGRRRGAGPPAHRGRRARRRVPVVQHAGQRHRGAGRARAAGSVHPAGARSRLRVRRRAAGRRGAGGRPSSRGADMSFSLTKDKRGVVVVGVDGQLIVGNRQDLKQKVLDALEAGARKFVIDFTKTGYIDSSGLGVLVSLSKKIREQGGDLRLAGLNEDLQTLFELTKLDTLFSITKTPAEALAAF